MNVHSELIHVLGVKIYSPNIAKIELSKIAKVRRSKIYYVRDYKKKLKEKKV